MKHLLVIVSVGLMPALALAQNALPASIAVKLLPTALADPLQFSVHAGVEVPLSNHISIQPEGAWVFGFLPDFQERLRSMNGFRLRLVGRYFVYPKLAESSVLEDSYLGALLGFQSYNQVIKEVEEVDPLTGVFVGKRDAERSIQAFELSFLWGNQRQLGKSLVSDFWIGFGVRRATHRWDSDALSSDPPDLLGDVLIGDFFLRPGFRPVFRTGLSLGWIISSK